MKRGWIPFALLIATILGCGGAGSVGSGNVTGLILDDNGDPVRGARVYVDSPTIKETYSNSSGSYSLVGVTAEDILVKSSLTVGSTSYYGENLARVFDQNQVQSHNIILINVNQIATVRGTVFGTSGTRVQGGRVSARPVSGGILSSTQAVTDIDGNYVLSGLRGGVSYQIIASFPGFRSSDVTRTIAAGTTATVNFSLGLNGDPILPTPNNLVATAWTSPLEITRSPESVRAIDNVRKFIDPRYKRATSSTRSTVNGNPVEVQIYWDRLDSLELLGWGISRQRNTDSWQDIDLLRDPLAESYMDSDPALRDGVTYNYSISALNTNYPDTNNSQSDFSNVTTVVPLGDMLVQSVNTSGGQVTFNWTTVSGAANYTVYVFDEYPAIKVSSYDNNFSSPATGSSWTYNLRPLSSGQRYYYIVMGANSDDSARTLSTIGSFIAP